MKRLIIGLSATLVSALALVGALPGIANAASAGLSITPRKNLVVKAGQTVHDKLGVSNLSKTSALKVNLQVIDFTYSDDGSGTPNFLVNKEGVQTAWSLKPFINLPASVVVPPGKTSSIDYSVSMPEGQEAGSYYSAITYTTGSAKSNSVNLQAAGVSLVFVTVPGEVHEDLQLLDFGAFQTSDGIHGQTAFINTTEPKRMAFKVKNQGLAAESPSGSITLENTWGDKILEVKNINPDDSLAIIGQSRQFSVCIKPNKQSVDTPEAGNGCASSGLKPGRYTATLDLFYGHNGNPTKEIQATVTFWYIPVWTILAALGVLILIILVIWWIHHAVVAMIERVSRENSGSDTT